MGLYNAPSLSTLKIDRFKGIDVSVPEDQAKAYRAADMLNMIPDAIGEVHKRPGIQFEKDISIMRRHNEKAIASFPSGTVVELVDNTHPIIMTDGLYILYVLLPDRYFPMIRTDIRPVVIRYGEKNIVFINSKAGTGEHIKNDDGSHIGITCDATCMVVLEGEGYKAVAYNDIGNKVHFEFDDETGTYKAKKARIKPDDTLVTCPTIMIGCDVSGGGTPLELINLLSPWVTERFRTKEGDNGVFYLNAQVVEGDARLNGAEAAAYFEVEVLKVLSFTNSAGEEIKRPCRIKRPLLGAEDGYNPIANRVYFDKKYNSGLTYEDLDGTTVSDISIGNAAGWIGESPIEGEDNVWITHWRAGFKAEFQKLCRCVCGSVYGVGGYKDRLFLGGGGEWSDRVYYSELEDPFYIGDLNYIKPEEGVKVMALDGVGDALAIITDQGIAFSSGKATEGDGSGYATDALFAVTARIPAPKPLNYNNTAVIGGEIVYLSEEGVIAVTSKDIYSERFAEHRSAMANRRLMADNPKQLLSLGRFLLVFCEGGICWLLDENQPNKEGDRPYSSHQYECYRMDGFDAECVFEENGALKLVRGTKVYRWTDGSLLSHYHDGADQAINARWETPWLYCSDFKKKKIFMKLGVLLGTLDGADSAIRVEGKKNDEEWKMLWDYDGTLCSFSFDKINFQFFTFAGAPETPIISRKIKIKKALRFKLRFANDIYDQTLILRECSLDYVQED